MGSNIHLAAYNVFTSLQEPQVTAKNLFWQEYDVPYKSLLDTIS